MRGVSMNIYSRLFRGVGRVELVQRLSGTTYVWLHVSDTFLPVAKRIAENNGAILVPVVGA